ncbi:hypothetical protein ABID44_001465 [Aquamicrobium ahrensii]|uniref:XRE family transcriptional regulator n=1 Tax=Aquamicrobium ahrensii TaxID=469551 RepID=A0ABV2KJ90_9HYPH
MSEADQVSGRQIAAGRVLAGVGQDRLAKLANISVTTLRRMESSEGPASGLLNNVRAVKAALENLGIRFIPENGGGVGVRLKFNSSEVRRIATLEGEGGIVADDDF